MELSDAITFAREYRLGVLVTLRRDGHPQLSNVLYHIDNKGAFLISTSASRAKYHNLRRDPWAALHVSRPDLSGYAVLEGSVALSPVATAPDDEATETLVQYYRDAAGEHPDWDEYRRAMVAERRVLATFTPARAYGSLP